MSSVWAGKDGPSAVAWRLQLQSSLEPYVLVHPVRTSRTLPCSFLKYRLLSESNQPATDRSLYPDHTQYNQHNRLGDQRSHNPPLLSWYQLLAWSEPFDELRAQHAQCRHTDLAHRFVNFRWEVQPIEVMAICFSRGSERVLYLTSNVRISTKQLSPAKARYFEISAAHFQPYTRNTSEKSILGKMGSSIFSRYAVSSREVEGGCLGNVSGGQYGKRWNL
ncbi:hypothetical protein BJ508DRAFT_312381 [Ascobolus immersus RN42]|uniref:Uncharacterized protein n=1 Tax=Ascobolus immersus RN42 TaxID=1160509 RepID=A0A3N4HPQ7_ASCIM|nr:hypothetical protein BJ508DRAFT_312381 [Ascobolus immersus RN42]